MAIPTFVSASTGTTQIGSSNTSIVLSAPPSIVAGNLLIAHIHGIVNGNSTFQTPPAGWIADPTNFLAHTTLQLFYKVATSSEPGSYTFTAATGTDAFGGAILQYSSAAGPLHPISQFNGSSVNLTAPSIIPYAAGLWLVFYGSGGDISTGPSGFTRRTYSHSSFTTASSYENNTTTTAGTSTGTAVGTQTASAVSVGGSILLTDVGPPVGVKGNRPTTAAATSVAANAPLNIASGDTLIALCFSASSTATAFGAPSGWTQAAANLPGTTAGNTAVFTKTATGSEPATYTFTGASPIAVSILCCGGSCSLDGTPAFNTGTGTTVTAPSVTPSSSNDLWLIGIAAAAAGGVVDTTHTMVLGDYVNSSGISLGPFYRNLPSSSATGTKAISTGNGGWTGMSMLVGAPVTAITGTATVALGPLTLTATGTVITPPVSGTATLSLGPLTVTAISTAFTSATATLTLGPLAVTIPATTITTAAYPNLPLGPLTLTATGMVSTPSGVPTITLGPLTVTTIGSRRLPATYATAALTDTPLSTVTLPADMPLATVTLQDQ